MNLDPASPPETSRKLVAWLLRHGLLLWIAALLLAIPATWRTVWLYANLQTEMEELLPRDAASVRALHELRQRMPGLQFLGVLADVGPNPPPERLAAAQRFIDDLAARVRAYPSDLVGGLRVGFAAERAFVEKHAPLLLERPDFDAIRDRLEERLRYEYGKRAGTLIDDSEPPPPLDFSDLEKRYEKQVKWGDLPNQRFTSPNLGTSLLLIETAFSTSARHAKELIGRVRSDMGALGGPDAYAPGMRVGFTGDVAISAEETQALMQDLTLSSLLVVAAVTLALLLFFRWLPSVFALLVPLTLATVYAFALASLLGVDVLNSNTAFLGSIIVGNGINFGIVQLARYLEERRAGQDVRESLARSLAWTRAGTLSAALAAAVAYGSLVAMQFRGFRQFGVIGGIGMVLAWGSTFVLTPPLLAWLDRKPRPADLRGLGLLPRLAPTARLSRFVARFPRAIVLVGLVFVVLAVLQVRRFSAAEQLEYDLSRMRRVDTWESGEGYWGRKMDRMLGQYLTPVVLMTDGPGEARAMARALREAMKRPPLDAMIDQVRTLDDALPPDQDDRVREVARIRKKLTPNVRANLTPEQRERLDTLFGPEAATPIELAEIPDTLLKGLKERSGRADRAVLVFPQLTAALWNGPRNATFVEALRQIAQAPERAGGRAARVAGAPPLTADVVASMSHDGPLASLLAFVGVMLTVLLLFRARMATPFVLSALLVGVLWMLALCMAMRIKINVINFIAFPITFGIGVDYAVNVMARFEADGARDVGRAIRGTGGAVSLCSVTTIIGYSSLLVAKNLGLYHFGFLAVLGEITCLTVAVVVLPAAVLLWRRRRNGEHGTPATASP